MADLAPWLAAAILAVLLLVAVAAWRLATTRGSRRQRRRLSVAQAGESDAEVLLEEEGYAILERQPTVAWSVEVDGEALPVRSRADLRVRRGHADFVAEVKTGDEAPDPTKPATRRQLLEYRLAFPGHRVLLVDVPARRILEVRFPDFGDRT